MLKDPQNQFIINNATMIDPDGGVIYFNEGALQQGEIFTTYKAYTGLGAYDTMIVSKTWIDSLTYLNHRLYQQYYKGILVEGAEYVEDYDGDDNLWLTTGHIVEGLNLSVTPAYNEEDALTIALDHIHANLYVWEVDTIFEFNSYYPVGELILAFTGDTIKASDYVLAWKFEINALDPSNTTIIYVNANTGDILRETDNRVAEWFNHHYYGTQSIDTHREEHWFIPDDWHLHANDRDRNVITSDYNVFQNSNYYKYSNSGNINDDWEWDANTVTFTTHENGNFDNNNKDATSAHFCATKAWDFFSSTYKRNGISGWGNQVRVVGGYNDFNAFYDGSVNNQDYILIGRKSNNNPYSSLDVVGHEFTHGVDRRSRYLYSLVAGGETGALAESFGDIFGFMVERFERGFEDWTIGEDGGAVSRDMQDPASISIPAVSGCNYPSHAPTYYLSSDWYTGSCDNKGVHYNCSVQNLWFYLLSMGGSNLVSGQTRYAATGIGIDAAAKIAYHALTTKVSHFENYPAVRTSTLAAAAELYGICSAQWSAVCKAWYAVNVGPNCGECQYTWYNGNINAFTTPVKNSINITNEVNLVLFPNPAKNIISLKVSESNQALFHKRTEYKIEVYSFDGKCVYVNQFMPSERHEIDIADLSQGIYFVKVSTLDWNKTIKFVKE